VSNPGFELDDAQRLQMQRLALHIDEVTATPEMAS
jgi:hypothetical protein